MNERSTISPSRAKRVLVLQGGGALGAYQAGVYEALAERGYQPEWIAGTSIGAINGAIIAGNAPERRVPALQQFWEGVSAMLPARLPVEIDDVRAGMGELNAAAVAAFGVSGFFKPHFPPAYLIPPGFGQPNSFYDTSPLRETLEQLVDFDRINAKEIRLSLGAVQVLTGELRYFDNQYDAIGPEHVMASGAMPPGFPPVEVDGEPYWDGGVVSNSPLEYVLDTNSAGDLLIFQIDLFSGKGPMPTSIAETIARAKDIRFASRARTDTRTMLKLHEARMALRGLLEVLPNELRNDPNAKLLSELAEDRKVTVARVVYCDKPYEGNSKDYEFSRQAMIEHWRAGVAQVAHCVAQNKVKLDRRPESATMLIEAENGVQHEAR